MRFIKSRITTYKKYKESVAFDLTAVDMYKNLSASVGGLRTARTSYSHSMAEHVVWGMSGIQPKRNSWLDSRCRMNVHLCVFCVYGGEYICFFVQFGFLLILVVHKYDQLCTLCFCLLWWRIYIKFVSLCTLCLCLIWW